MENNSEKETKNKVEKAKISPMDADIMNLNNDDSFAPIGEEEERVPLTEEEKEEVRKKLLILLVVIFLSLVLLVVILIFDPFSKDEPKKENKKEENVEETPQVNQKKLIEYEDGEIDLTNDEISILMEEIVFKDQDHYENNALTLFVNDINVTNLSDNYKLFLLGKTSDFNSAILQNAKDTDFCNNEFKISKDQVDKLLMDRFNTNVTKYENFLYHYYDYDGYNSTLRFTYFNDEYTGKCYHPNTIVKSAIQQEVIKATKEGDKLYLDCKVIFINENGVYKDPNFKEMISTGQTSSPKTYIGKGNIYRYTYDISQNNYSLTSISLQK